MPFVNPSTFFKNILCLFILLATFTIYSQEKDSLQQYSHKELDSLYFKYFQEDLTKSRQYAEILFKKASQENNTSRIVKGLLRMSVTESQLRNFDSSHVYIDRAISIIQEKLKDESLKNEYLLYKGNIYYTSADYDKALEYYTKSYEYEKNNNNIQNSINIAHNIAMIKSIVGNYNEALKILKENYSFFSSKEEGEKPGFNSSKLLSTLIGLSDTYIKSAINEENKDIQRKFLDSAEFYNKIGLKKCAIYEDKYRHIFFLIREAKIAHEKKNYHKAIQTLKLADNKAQIMEQRGSFSTIYFHLGKNYKALEQFDNAILFLKKADSIALTDTKHTKYTAKTYLMLIDMYFKKEDFDNALKYHKLFIEIDKITDKQTIEMQKNVYQKYDIPLLNDKIKKLTDTTIEQKSKYTNVLVVLTIIICAFIGFLFYNRNKQKKNRLVFSNLMKQLEAKKKESLEKNIIKKEEKPKSKLTIDNEKVNEILKALDKFEQKKQFLDTNCDLAFVAKKVKTNKAYLSKVIHSEKQQKFIQYITNLRINYALERLKEDKLFRSYDIKSIAAELGFKSPDSFSRAFKNKTGIYPSYYIKNINKINTSEDK